jgi:hypothetical protein
MKQSLKIKWAIMPKHLALLIPKQRGQGYCRQPVGIAANDLSRFISRKPIDADCCGLEMALEIDIEGLGVREARIYVYLIARFRRCEMDYEPMKPNDFYNLVISLL